MAGRRNRGWVGWLVGAVVVLVVAGAGFWAGRVTLGSAPVVSSVDQGSLLVGVSDETVGKSFQYNVTVSRERVPAAVNLLSGVVTSVGKSGVFKVGGVLYRVNGVPVRVVQGSTPFFRDLGQGQSGADVAQLKAALRSMKLLSGSTTNKYDLATFRAVKAWQKKMGVPETGVVGRGELVAVGKSFQYNVTVTRDRTAVAVNMLSGVVTSVSKSGSFKVGAVLYRVDGVPVRVVQGSMPYYRSLSQGISGSDVSQLKAALRSLKYLSGSSGNKFDAATYRAVRAWQKALGMAQSGVIGRGELVAVPKLPAVLTLDASLWKGAVLSGGEKVLFINAGTPRFVLELGATEALQIAADTTLTVKSGDASWPAVVTGQEQTESGTVQFDLASPDGGVVCADQCDILPADQATTYLLSQVSVVAPVSGPGVPVSAIITKVDGTTVVYVDDNGARVETPVTVLGSQDGIAVVDGVQDGQQVFVFGSGPTPSSTETGG